ncbi:hypothetical protein KUCAC02_031455, partial [Chaenocephalus aceratus]
CLLGLNSGPATWPSASRLVEAICSQLCRLHPAATRFGGIMRTRWSLILTDYVAIREAVLASPRLMAQTDIQLFELNQRTLSQWFSRRQKDRGVSVLLQGTGVVPAVAMAVQPLPPAKGLTTAYRKRKAAEADAARGGPSPWSKARQQTGQYTCSKCGQAERIDTGHTRIAGVSYCAAAGGKTVEEWREEMKRLKRDPEGGE